MPDSLGDRMKGYENAYRTYLPKRLPLIIRVDGKAFHSFTRKMNKPWDEKLETCMEAGALYLCDKIQDAQLAYIQSDEISILVHNYKRLNAEAWFDNNLQKLTSISASLVTAAFNKKSAEIGLSSGIALFDSRVWILPEAEVCNYFIWRQQDSTRNSLSMLAQSLYSHKELQGRKSLELQEMCFQKGINWNDMSTSHKRGRCAVRKEGKWVIDNEIPIFTQDRNYIDQHLITLE